MLSEHTLTHMLLHDPCLSRSCLSLFSTTSWVRSDTRQTPPPLEFLFRWSHPLYLYPSWRTVFLAFTHRPKDETFVGEIKHVQFCHDELKILHMTHTAYNTWYVVGTWNIAVRAQALQLSHKLVIVLVDSVTQALVHCRLSMNRPIFASTWL